MAALAQLRKDLEQEENNLKEANEILQLVPDSTEAHEIKEQVLARKKVIESKIAQLSNGNAAPSSTSETASRPSVEPPSAAKPDHAEGEVRMYKVGENVLAKYRADRTFYPATIVSVMGSSSAPIYTVRFKGYEGTETVRGHEIRDQPQPATLKRKADDSVAVPSPVATPVAPAGSVFSAPADIDEKAAGAIKEREALKKKLLEGAETVPPKKKKPTKATQALEKQKSNWQDFKSKTAGSKIGKAVNKESMFRTGENPLAKVGFTGSGKPMTKDQAKEKYKFEGSSSDRRREHR